MLMDVYVVEKCIITKYKLFYLNYTENAKKQSLEFNISQHSMRMKLLIYSHRE